MYTSADVKTRSKPRIRSDGKEKGKKPQEVTVETPVNNQMAEKNRNIRSKPATASRRKKSTRKKGKQWLCGRCETANPESRMTCKSCKGKLPVITLFKASRRDLVLGDPIRLTWDVIDARRVVINPGQELVENKGVLDVDPDETTKYTITAYNEIGTRQLSTKVTLSPPVIREFQAADEEINIGYPTILHWEIENGAEIEINMDVGDVSGQSFTEAYFKRPGICTLTVKNKAGSASASIPLTLKPPEIGDFYATTSIIRLGEANTLNWEVSNAEKVIISPNVGDVSKLNKVEVCPEKTTTYVLRAINHSGTVEKSLELVLPPPKVVVFSADSELSTEGEPVELFWEVENAYRVSIDQEIGEVPTVGKMKVKPNQAYTTYKLTAEGHSGVVEKTFMITRFPIPLEDTLFDMSQEPKVDMNIDEKRFRTLTDFEEIEKDLRKKTKEQQRRLQIKRVQEMELTDDLLTMEKASVRSELRKWIGMLKEKFLSKEKL